METNIYSTYLNIDILAGMNRTAIIQRKREMRAQNAILQRNKCSGCGHRIPITLSHKIKVSYRKDLELVLANTNNYCIQCHEIWEYKLPGVELLLDYQASKKYIQETDELLFNRLFSI